MCNYIIVGILYPGGDALHFPVAVITKKESVELMLELDGVIDSEVSAIVERHRVAKRASVTWKSRTSIVPDLEANRRETDQQLL